jgi:hypothetical protein
MPTFFGYMSPPSARPATSLGVGDVSVRLREWSAGIFDWAVLATKHDLRVEYQLADVLTSGVGAEMAVEALDLERAKHRLRRLRALMAIAGVQPFFMPFVGSHSIDDFSNISAPASHPDESRQQRAERINSVEEKVRVELLDFELSSAPVPDPVRLDQGILEQVMQWERTWQNLTFAHPEVRVLDGALRASPAIQPLSQAVLHVWTCLENLFPEVQSEVRFRMGLNLAQLLGDEDRLATYESIRRSYNARSRIAHGSMLSDDAVRSAWDEAWALLRKAAISILRRQGLPTETQLMIELMSTRRM